MRAHVTVLVVAACSGIFGMPRRCLLGPFVVCPGPLLVGEIYGYRDSKRWKGDKFKRMWIARG